MPTNVVIHAVGTAKTTRRGNWVVKCWDVRGTIEGWPGRGLGRFTAVALATELRSLIEGSDDVVVLTTDRRRRPSGRAEQQEGAIE